MIQFAARQGAATAELLAVVNYSQEKLMDEDLRVEAASYNAVLEAAMAQIKDPFFGLHAGEHFSLSAAGLVAQITQTSATIKEDLQYCCDFSMLACRAIPLRLEKENGEYVLRMKPDPLWQVQSPPKRTQLAAPAQNGGLYLPSHHRRGTQRTRPESRSQPNGYRRAARLF
ncbi:MAG TPA: AraC family transcriptional regulator ligand-binding domain-containing protein [Phaeodactylibacter sp.]|nr:AraC family transcriptional regulator ligand-binding domain-containing protein [Phaeodactylibacter sp.]